MENTVTYIKMSEKAWEIQALVIHRGTREVKWNEGDMIALEIEKGNYKVFMYNGCAHSEGFIEPEVYSSYCVWLPRQDDLQKMIGDSPFYNIKNSMWSILDDFRNFAFATNFKDDIPLSMEQLWFCFVMKEEHNKYWNGDDWVNG